MMQRVKLKARYSIAFVLFLVIVCVYCKFPLCDQKSKSYEVENEIDALSWNNVAFLKNSKVPVYRRELLRKLETRKEEQFENERTKKPSNFILFLQDLKKQEHDLELSMSLQKVKQLSKLQMIENQNYENEIENRNENKADTIDVPGVYIDVSHKEDVKAPIADLFAHPDTFEEDGEEQVDNEDGENKHEMLSPKRNDKEEKLAPKRSDRQEEKQVDFFQINMEDDVKKEYFFDSQEANKLLPHLTPQEVKSKLSLRLPWWEVLEMASYPRVWYVGEGANKISYNESDPSNYGFDYVRHDEARLKIVKADHLEYRYEILKKLGTGSYGTVVQARDHAVPVDQLHHMVAVKVMHNNSSAVRYFKEELDLMKLVHNRTNNSNRFSTVLRTFFFRNHLCIVMELLGTTLDDVRDGPMQDLSLLRKYTLDLLRGLILLHGAEIIHGDLKPENLMLAPNSTSSSPVHVKIADFNLACIQGSKDFPCPGRYFQTRYYRAPEVILSLNYTTTADMWSVGVILAELYLDNVPFYGESSTDQLASIMEVMGLVPPYMVETSSRIHAYQEAVCYECKNGFKRLPYRKSLEKVLAGVPPVLFDFIQHCFVLDYRKRMTSKEALRHPFVTSSYHENTFIK